MLECGFAEFLYRGYPCLSKLNVSLKLRRGRVWLGAMLLHRHGAIVWYAFGVAWLNSRGVGLLFSLMCFCTLMQFVCAVCMQAMTHSVDNVASQQAVELLVLGLGFVEQCWLRLFLGDQLQLKMG